MVEISSRAVDYRRRGLRAEVADAFDFQDKQESFGGIIAIDIFEHFSKEERLEIPSAVHRV